MMTMNSVKKLSNRHTALGELKALLHKLMTGDIRVNALDFAVFGRRNKSYG